MMYQLPEIKPRKKPKQAYRKPEAVRLLEQLADAEARRLHPNIAPEHLAPRKFRDDSANQLTACIVQYAKLKGCFASRLNNTGIFRNGKYTRSTSRRGLPDVIVTRDSMSLFIEVKVGRDRMSTFQEAVRDDQQRAGGLYFVAHDFTEFKEWFDGLVPAGLHQQDIRS